MLITDKVANVLVSSFRYYTDGGIGCVFYALSKHLNNNRLIKSKVSFPSQHCVLFEEMLLGWLP